MNFFTLEFNFHRRETKLSDVETSELKFSQLGSKHFATPSSQLSGAVIGQCKCFDLVR